LNRAAPRHLALAASLLVASLGAAQTTLPGPAIDVELYNAADGGNDFCAAPGDTFWAGLYIRPASGAGSTMTCSVACGSAVGGPGSLAAAAVDVAFDGSRLSYFAAAVNPDPGFAAVDGLVQEQNVAQGRVGWALAGDWTPDGSTAGALADPCAMLKLGQPDWVARFGFNVLVKGESVLDLRGEPSFPLSFADVCGMPAYSQLNGGIDEVVPATVSTECPELADVLFRNGVETGDASVWTASVG
jgi:hypothetical protein